MQMFLTLYSKLYHSDRAKQIKDRDQLQVKPSCCQVPADMDCRFGRGGNLTSITVRRERVSARWVWDCRKVIQGIERIRPECWVKDWVMFGQGLRKYHMQLLHVRRLSWAEAASWTTGFRKCRWIHVHKPRQANTHAKLCSGESWRQAWRAISQSESVL